MCVNGQLQHNSETSRPIAGHSQRWCHCCEAGVGSVSRYIKEFVREREIMTVQIIYAWLMCWVSDHLFLWKDHHWNVLVVHMFQCIWGWNKHSGLGVGDTVWPKSQKQSSNITLSFKSLWSVSCFNVFETRHICSPCLYLFYQKYSKNSKIWWILLWFIITIFYLNIYFNLFL